MIQPAPESAVAVDDTEGTSRIATFSHYRLPLLPASTADHVSATIHLRSREFLDENSVFWEAIALLDGEQVFDEGGYEDRRLLIRDAVSHLAAAAAKSRKKDMKAAGAWLTNYLASMDDIPTDDLDSPEMVNDGGGIWGDGEQVSDDDSDGEQTPATADGLAGEVGDGASPPADVAAESLADDTAAPIAPKADNYGGPTPQAIAAFRRELDAARDELAEAAIEFSHVKTIHKAAKDRFDNAVENMASIAGRGPQSTPLFDGRGGDGESTATQPPQAGASEMSESTTTADPNAWRKEPIESLGLPPKLTDRLEEAGISTIGELEDKRGSRDGLRGISGIGPAKVTVIEDAVIGWLSKHRDAGVFEQAAAESTRDE